MSELLQEGLQCERFDRGDLTSVTTKSLYISFTETMPPPMIELKYADMNWLLIWSRLCSGVLSPTARNYLFLIIHERVSTRERCHRLAPNIYESPTCLKCFMESESINHRYLYCSAISRCWDKLRELLLNLDFNFVFEADQAFLNLSFTESLRSPAVLWLIGEYVCFIEKESVLRNRRLTSEELMYFLTTSISECKLSRMPNIGFIPGLSQTGIG